MLASLLTFSLLLLFSITTITTVSAIPTPTSPSTSPISKRNVITWPPQAACENLPASKKTMAQYEGRREDIVDFINYANCVIEADWDFKKDVACAQQYATFPYSCIWTSTEIYVGGAFGEKNWTLGLRGKACSDFEQGDMKRQKCIQRQYKKFCPAFAQKNLAYETTKNTCVNS